MLKTGSRSGLYPLIRSTRKPLAIGRGRIPIPGFIRSTPKLVAYAVAHSFPLGGVGRDFSFIEEGTRMHFSCLLGTF